MAITTADFPVFLGKSYIESMFKGMSDGLESATTSIRLFVERLVEVDNEIRFALETSEEYDDPRLW